MGDRRRIIDLDVRLDGERVTSETTAIRAGPNVVSVITVLPDHGVLFQLTSTFIGHKGVDTHVAHLVIDPLGEDPEIHTEDQDRTADEDGIVRDPRDRDIQLAEDTTPEPIPHAHSATQSVPIDIQKTTPNEIQITTHDITDIKLAHSQAYDLSAHTDKPTHTLFGAWQTEHEQGFVTATQSPDGTDIKTSREELSERDIKTKLTDRIGQAIERSQAHKANTIHEQSLPEANPELQNDHPAQLEPATHDTDGDQARDTSRDRDHQPEREPVERDPYIEQAIQQARERQHAWEHGIEQERDNDHGYAARGIPMGSGSNRR
jgi:hypothetical protein